MAAPLLLDLVPSLEELEPHLARVRAGAPGPMGGAGTNAEGGDPVSHADPRLLARHLGHYLAAADVAAPVVAAAADPVLLDVGCGTGAFSAWLAERLEVPLLLADHDPAVLAAAVAVHDVTDTHVDLAAAPAATVVTAMEVLEHIPPAEQRAFLAAALDRVAPGGVLVLSTPDESRYPGGWSGYAPHVGCVDATRLAQLLGEVADGAEVEVLRVVGGPYDVPAPRRWLEAVGNRVWTALQRHAPGVALRVAASDGEVDRSGPVLDVARVPAPHRVRVLPASEGRGGSLVGIVRR